MRNANEVWDEIWTEDAALDHSHDTSHLKDVVLDEIT